MFPRAPLPFTIDVYILTAYFVIMYPCPSTWCAVPPILQELVHHLSASIKQAALRGPVLAMFGPVIEYESALIVEACQVSGIREACQGVEFGIPSCSLTFPSP